MSDTHHPNCPGPGFGCTLDCECSAADICRANEWRAGDVLEGYQQNCSWILTITAVGRGRVLASESDGPEELWTLSNLCWVRKQGALNAPR